MGYVVSVGNGLYLKKSIGSKVTSNKDLAYRWGNREKALNVARTFSGQFPEAVVEMSDSLQQIKEEVKESFSKEYSLQEVTDLLKDLSLFLSHRKEELSLVVKATNKQIVDIEHEAEFNKYNVCDGYKCYKKLHDIRVKRREAKDELAQIGYLSGINVISPNSVIQAMKCIDGMDGRKYRPRYEEEDESSGGIQG